MSRARHLRVGIWTAVSATVPQAQHEDVGDGNLVAHLVLPDDDPADLPRCKRIQLLTNARIVEQPVRRAGELLDNAGGGLWRDRLKVIMQADKVRRRLASPLDLHFTGGGNGLRELRLAAHACMA